MSDCLRTVLIAIALALIVAACGDPQVKDVEPQAAADPTPASATHTPEATPPLSRAAPTKPAGSDGQQAPSAFDRDIYVMDADGGNVQQLTDDPGWDDFPAWSPDGTRIAFASNRDAGVNYEIYVMDADGNNIRQLTDDPGWDWEPTWSPDGTRIAFTSTRDGDGDWDIYVMDADGGNVQQLTDDPAGDWQPAWSRGVR